MPSTTEAAEGVGINQEEEIPEIKEEMSPSCDKP